MHWQLPLLRQFFPQIFKEYNASNYSHLWLKCHLLQEVLLDCLCQHLFGLLPRALCMCVWKPQYSGARRPAGGALVTYSSPSVALPMGRGLYSASLEERCSQPMRSHYTSFSLLTPMDFEFTKPSQLSPSIKARPSLCSADWPWFASAGGPRPYNSLLFPNKPILGGTITDICIFKISKYNGDEIHVT